MRKHFERTYYIIATFAILLALALLIEQVSITLRLYLTACFLGATFATLGMTAIMVRSWWTERKERHQNP